MGTEMDKDCIKVLVVDDDEDDYVMTRDLIAEIPEARYQVEWLPTYDEALKELDNNRHDVYLFDYRLGKHSGLDLLREAIDKGCKAPVILLTGQGDREIDVAAMKAGASDYLIKGKIDANVLERSMRYAVEHKMAKDALHRSREELRETYEELKAVQSSLHQREKMASIGQLAAGVAHEINNPVGFIMSNLGTLQKYVKKLKEFICIQTAATEQLPDEKIAALKERAKALQVDFVWTDIDNLISESLDGTKRIQKIVQDLKSFSHVDEAECKISDINAGIESTLNIVWNELKYTATVTKEYGPVPKTYCNLAKLNQVFMNLLLNAVQAIEKQGEIRIKTWERGGWIYVAISDTGCGMPPELKSRIFEPFYTTKEVGKGTGLGLSIAYDIVKKHDGEILVESAPGRGSTFTVKIPLVQEESCAKA
jgi:signal transduction histidine kinase